jgi:hypothetical protein
MNFFNKLFKKDKNLPGSTIPEFANLNKDEKLALVMTAGDSGNARYFELMKYCIVHETTLELKFAALKRIHNFKDQPELKIIFDELRQKPITEKWEPYFSMALNRLGYISLEEFEKKITGS